MLLLGDRVSRAYTDAIGKVIAIRESPRTRYVFVRWTTPAYLADRTVTEDHFPFGWDMEEDLVLVGRHAGARTAA